MGDLVERAQLVKQRWSMDAVFEQMLGEPVPANRKVHSPFSEADNSPSCHIYDDSYYDYSTGKHGDVITLVRELRRCSFEEAVELLEQEADDLGLVAVDRVKVEKPKFVVPPLYWWTGLPSVLIDGISPKQSLPGVSQETLGFLAFNGKIAMTNTAALAIIHQNPDTGEPVGIKYRHGDGKKTSEPGSDFSSFLYKPVNWRHKQDYCVLTEGETDSWAWLSARWGDHVFSLPSGAQSWRDKFLEQLTGYDKIYIQFDNDKPGRDATDKVARAVGYGRAEFLPIPGIYKDCREAIAAGWVPPVPSLSEGEYRTQVENLQ